MFRLKLTTIKYFLILFNLSLKVSPGAFIIKLFYGCNSFRNIESSAFVKPNKKVNDNSKTLAYCTIELITAVKGFMTQAPGRGSKPGPCYNLLFCPSHFALKL
jgi:hypothetical protein